MESNPKNISHLFLVACGYEWSEYVCVYGHAYINRLGLEWR